MKKLLLLFLFLPTLLIGQNYYAMGDTFIERTKRGDIASSYNLSALVSIEGDFLIVQTFAPDKYRKISISKREDTEGSIILHVRDKHVQSVSFIFLTSSIVFFPIRDEDNTISFFYDEIKSSE